MHASCLGVVNVLSSQMNDRLANSFDYTSLMSNRPGMYSAFYPPSSSNEEGGRSLGEAILVGGRTGAVEQKIYKWKQYEANGTNTYYWKRYNAESDTVYTWNKWNTQTQYTWNKWGLNITYQWNKYSLNTTYEIGRTSDLTQTTMNAREDSFETYYVVWATLTGLYCNKQLSTWITGNLVNQGYFKGKYTPVPQYYVGMDSPYYWYKYFGVIDNLKFNYTTDSDRWWTATISYYVTSVPKYSQGSTSYGTVTSTNANAYPNGGKHTDNFYYSGRTTLYSRGSYVGTVTSTASNTYPNGSWSGSNWYDGMTSGLTRGSTKYDDVTSTESGSYPANGEYGGFWYISAGSTTTWYKGSIDYGTIYSSDRSAYPDNNYVGSFWYVYDGLTTEWFQGAYLQDRLSTDRDRWPDNGYADGFWYVFDGEA